MNFMPFLKPAILAALLGLTALTEPLHVVKAPMLIGVLMIAILGAAVNLAPGHRKDDLEQMQGAGQTGHPSRTPNPFDVKLKRALIVGSGPVARALASNLESDGYFVVGFVDDLQDNDGVPDPRILGGRAATSAIVAEYSIDSVFLANSPSWQQRLVETLVVDHPAVDVSVVPSYHEALMRTNRLDSSGDIALIRLTATVEYYADAAKRLFDLVAAMFGLLVTSPIIVTVAVLIRLSSKGPVIFAQERVGRFGRPFMLYKFRTMVQDAEAKTGPVLADGKRDTRLTPIGRWLRMFRVDELPQFWNVIRGEMSMVGPRPERPFFVEQFKRRLPAYSKRHTVRPGITGLAQVYGGYHTDPQDKLRFDLIYVSQQSLWFDLTILVRTILVVCRPHR